MPWFDGMELDDAAKARMVTSGWDKLEPGPAALAIFKSFREVENKLGLPNDRVLRIPDANDTVGWKDIHAKLGVPADKAQYDFSAIKFADGSALDEEAVGFYRDLAHSMNLPPATAQAFVARMIKAGDDAVAAEEHAAAELRGRAASENETKLKLNWGANFDAFKVDAERTLDLLGLGELKGTLNPDQLERVRIAGQKITGEPRLLGGGGPTPPPQMSRDEAYARHGQLVADTEWVARWRAGGQAEQAEWVRVTTAMAGQRQ